MQTSVKSGNEKRIESCKKLGAEKKRMGHQREKDFLRKYNSNESDKPTEYGPTADTSICLSHPICDILRDKIKPANFNVSNKSGNNIQLVLGNVPELKDINVDILSDRDYVRKIFNKYFQKCDSVTPAGILAYYDCQSNNWIFFNMDDVVNFIADKCKWRKLDSGRIKGDFDDNSKKGRRNYITYEYRRTHNSYFLGFNGDAGIKFINLLKDDKYGITYYEDKC